MIATLSLCLLVSPQDPQVSKPDILRVGHVAEFRGSFDADGRFVAEKAELFDPDEDDVLIGTVPDDQRDPAEFTLLGQIVTTDEETTWQEISRASLAGKRIKVKGRWKGPTKFAAQSIGPRGSGRDRIGARIDELHPVEGGFEARLMKFTVFIGSDAEIVHAKPVEEYVLAPERKIGRSPGSEHIERDEDDSFGSGIELTPTLRLQGQLEFRIDDFRDFDLDSSKKEDRTDYEGSGRLRVTWTPSDDLVGLAELRFHERYRRDEDNGVQDPENDHGGSFGETWLQWRDVYGHQGFDVTVGRQDFDDPREWIYDENLDALRFTWIHPTWRFDLSGSTVVANGTERNEASDNFIAYLSNNDEDTYLAAWTVYRDIDDFNSDDGTTLTDGFTPDETSWHFGVRAIGEWLPQNEIWADFAYEIADRPLFNANDDATGQSVNVSAWAYDVGTTWSPPFADPLYFSVGYALGSGKGDDGTFRQTGFQDNTDKFGGVTSFQYYGELFDPELSNLGILTFGVGALVSERTSLDFVVHSYTQDEASAEFSPLPIRDANLRTSPNGNDADLGWEADLIFGWRRYKDIDLEIVGATFEPGDGFDTQENAYYLKFQIRYRF